MSRIVINGAFRGQRVTGQQRYATEVAQRLLIDPEVEELRPKGLFARSTLLVWLWVQLVLPILAGDRVIVSMTARAPVWRRRTVLVVHDLFVLNHPEWYSRRYIWTHAPLLRLQLRSADTVVAVSEPVAQQLVAFRGDYVAVAPNAPSSEFDATVHEGPDDEAVRERGLAAGSYLLAVGSRDPRKNLPRLLAAYGSLAADVRARTPLLLVGGGSAIFRPEELTVPDGVIDAKLVSDDHLRQLYRHSRCVVLVSLDEGFGLPIVEAATAGAPALLVSEIPVFRWICGNQARYVDPSSVHDIAAGLVRELDGAPSSRLDHGRFTWEKTAAAITSAPRG